MLHIFGYPLHGIEPASTLFAFVSQRRIGNGVFRKDTSPGSMERFADESAAPVASKEILRMLSFPALLVCGIVFGIPVGLFAWRFTYGLKDKAQTNQPQAPAE